MAKTILITGGGTGGHIFPALAVAAALQQCEPSIDLHYIGKTAGMEATKVQQAGLPFTGITFYGMPRRGGVIGLFEKSLWGLAWLWAMLCVLRYFIKLKPDLVFATGGYVTAPVLLAAVVARVPFYVHEPDAQPGLVNCLFGRWAAGVTTAFEAAIPKLCNANAIATGNPVRAALAQLPPPETVFSQWFRGEHRPVMLVMGGSQGAQSLNDAVLEALPLLVHKHGLGVLHQVGEKPWPEFQMALQQAQSQWSEKENGLIEMYYRPMAFIEDMPAALGVASLALCRAGSMTLSELGVAQLPAILVPYPHAAANHQWHNAQAFVQQGVAAVVADSELSGKRLLAEIDEMFPKLPIMRMAYATNPTSTRAAEAIAQQLLAALH